MQLSIKRVISVNEFAKRIKFSLTGFKENGFGRRYAVQESNPLWKEAFGFYNLTPWKVEPVLKNITGHHYQDGACTHFHKDTTVNGYVHTRCNVMIKKPKFGGNPVIDGETIIVNEGEMWLLLASEEMHGSTPIREGERIIFSFGALVEKSQISNIVLNNLIEVK